MRKGILETVILKGDGNSSGRVTLDKNTSKDLLFNWSAIAVKDPTTTIGSVETSGINY